MPTSSSRHERNGFTLVELLASMAVTALLAAVLFPAAQAARESARRVTCSSNMRQLAIANANFEAARNCYPSSWLPSKRIHDGRTSGWSSHVQLLPFLENDSLHEAIDLSKQYGQTATDSGKPVGSIRMAELLCPSEPGDTLRIVDEKPSHYPLNYGANVGVWFVFDPITGKGGEGAFYPTSRLKSRHFTDGLSKTIAFSEVKAWTPYFRNAGKFRPAMPNASEVCSLGGQFRKHTGHTRWVDGRAQSTGVTSAFPPNTIVPCVVDEIQYDIDWNNQCEGLSRDRATYSAVTSRSHHQGGVHAVAMDASARFVSNDIASSVWRASFTRRGVER